MYICKYKCHRHFLSYQVTVLQLSRSSGSETFTFLLDESLRNITLYITGSRLTFTITNPAGITACVLLASPKGPLE